MKEKKGNFLTGIIGALLGAIVGTIPTALLYVFLDMYVGYAFILIGFCAAFGYKLFKGRRNFGFAVVITFLFTILAPLVYLGYYIVVYFESLGIPADQIIDNINMAELIKQAVITLLFSILGASFAVKPVKAYCVGDSGVDTSAANAIPEQITAEIPVAVEEEKTAAEEAPADVEETETAAEETSAE